MEALREEQDVVICHHCHIKVQVVDIGNGANNVPGFDDFEENDDEFDAMAQMAGEELAGWMGIEEEA